MTRSRRFVCITNEDLGVVHTVGAAEAARRVGCKLDFILRNLFIVDKVCLQHGSFLISKVRGAAAIFADVASEKIVPYTTAPHNRVGVQVKNLTTGEVTEYPSTGACSRFFKVGPASVHKHLHYYNSNCKVFHNNYLIRYVTDAPWPRVPQYRTPDIATPNRRAVLVTVDGVVTRYPSMARAAAELGLSYRSLTYRLSMNDIIRIDDRITITFEDVESAQKSRIYKVRNLKTGEIHTLVRAEVFKMVGIAACELGLYRGAAARTHRPYRRFGDYIVSRDDFDIAALDVRKIPVSLTKKAARIKVLVSILRPDIEIEYRSINAAALAHDVPSYVLYKHRKDHGETPYICHGIEFRIIKEDPK